MSKGGRGTAYDEAIKNGNEKTLFDAKPAVEKILFADLPNPITVEDLPLRDVATVRGGLDNGVKGGHLPKVKVGEGRRRAFELRLHREPDPGAVGHRVENRHEFIRSRRRTHCLTSRSESTWAA